MFKVTTSSRDPNGTPQSDYDGTHVSVDVKLKTPIFSKKASQDRTGDGLKDFFSVKPR